MILKYKNIIFILLIMIMCVLLTIFTIYIKKQSSSPSSVKSGVFKSSPIWDIETQNPITSSPIADSNGRIFIRTSDSIIAIDFIMDTNSGYQRHRVILH